MKLSSLFSIHGQLDWRQQDPNQDVQSVVFDSRQINRNSVFVAVRGNASDGHEYLADVCRELVPAIVVEDLSKVPNDFRGAVLQVLDSRLALQLLSQIFFEKPGDALLSFAVTGTNGKTSVCYILEYFLQQLGLPCGVIGTIDHHLGGRVWESALTTPDPWTLQQRLQDFSTSGAQAFVIEASSHALKQNRIHQGFDVCVFTNLSRDHMDYHADEEEYFQCKAQLFSQSFLKDVDRSWGLTNTDDLAGRRLCEGTARTMMSFGQEGKPDFLFSNVTDGLVGSEFLLTNPVGEKIKIQSPLVGLHNVYNVVAAIGALYLANLNWKKAIETLPRFPGIPGRLERVSSSKGIHAFVDFAHSDDALRNVLSHLKSLLRSQGHGRLICLFGCGGDRDQGKRPLMAKVAEEFCDQILVTSDNPRGENPQEIIEDIRKGFVSEEGKVVVDVDRADAIHKAVALCQVGDILLVAGKGHEAFQEISGQKKPFNDVQILKEALDA